MRVKTGDVFRGHPAFQRPFAQVFGVGAVGKNAVGILRRGTACTPVPFGRVAAEFPHAAKHCDTPCARHTAEHAQRSLHRIRAGVITVLIDGKPVFFIALLTQADRPVGSQAVCDLVRFQAQQPAAGGRRQGVHNVVRALGGDLDGLSALGPDHGEAQRAVRARDVLGAEVAGRIFLAKPDDAAEQPVFLIPQEWFVAVQYCDAAAGRQAFQNFHFRPADTLARAQKLNVRGADHGDDRDIGLPAGSHGCDLSKARHTHLKDRSLGIFVHSQRGKWHADGVIQVAFGLERLIPLGQYGGDHLLGGRLADRARDRDHRAVKLRPVPARKIQKRLPGIGDVQRRDGIGFLFAMGQDSGRAALDRLADKVMAVKPFALDGDKQAARTGLARVAHNARDDRVGRAGAARPGRSLGQGKLLHLFLCPFFSIFPGKTRLISCVLSDNLRRSRAHPCDV